MARSRGWDPTSRVSAMTFADWMTEQLNKHFYHDAQGYVWRARTHKDVLYRFIPEAWHGGRRVYVYPVVDLKSLKPMYRAVIADLDEFPITKAATPFAAVSKLERRVNRLVKILERAAD